MGTTTESTNSSKSHTVDPEIYGRSGDIDKHVDGVKKQYDTAEKREFYAQVMGDGTSNIHFGKWDNIDLEQDGAYGKASEQMTDYMFALAMDVLQKNSNKTIGPIEYVDLGSGTGGAAIRLLGLHDASVLKKATLLNLCEEQNATAQKDAASKGLSDRIEVQTGTYEKAPFFADNSFDLAFSQDAFVHAFSKVGTYQEALRIVKPGGAFIFCDLMCGTGPDVSDEELQTFAQTNMVNDWLSPAANVEACKEAGWQNVTFVDLTADIKISFQLMGKKVEKMIARGGDGIDPVLLSTYQKNLANRVLQVERGVFQWGVIHATKKV